MEKSERKKLPKVVKLLLIILIVLVSIAAVWTAISLIGRVDTGVLISENNLLRLSLSNPIQTLDGIIAHDPLRDISGIPALAPVVDILNELNENRIFKNSFVRFAARGKIELAMISQGEKDGIITAAYDLRLLTPLMRILPAFPWLLKVPNLYYVKAGDNSHFEFSTGETTFYIGQYRNLLYITNDAGVFENRSVRVNSGESAFNNIKPSEHDAVLIVSPQFVSELFSEQDSKIEEIINNLEFESKVEVGITIAPKKLEFKLAATLSSDNAAVSRFLESRSSAPEMADLFPATAQYATILSAGTLDELYKAAGAAGVDFDDTLRLADNASRFLLGLTIDDLLFSWSGKEFAVFGMEGRPHPVIAINVKDEQKRQQVFDRAFSSLVLNEDARLNIDGMRLPRIALPDFLQFLLSKWNINLPSPYYTVYKDFLFLSESAETLLSALRAMQRNDVLPRTAEWRNIAGGKTDASSFSLYYSLDLSVPFFLRKNTTMSAFLALYREGLVRMRFDRGLLQLTISLVPGSGNGVTLVNGYPLDTGGRLSNQVFGAGRGANSRVFFASGNSAFSVNLADNSISEMEGQGNQWIIPAAGIGRRDEVFAWIVSDRGRVTLVDSDMEPAQGFPVLTGLRISSAPAAFDGRLYICDEDGQVCAIDEKGIQTFWETAFFAAIRSPPSFLSLTAGRNTRNYAAVYPKSFFGELWLLDEKGNVLPGWSVPTTAGEREGETADSGIGFGSPLVFAHNNSVYVTFITQSGELAVYDESAAIVSPFPIYIDGIFFLQPVYDGEYLWLISEAGTLYRVSIEGELLYQNITGLTVREEGYLTVFDCNGDNVPEVFITGEGNALYAYNRNFRSLEGFPLPVWGRPYFVDAQNSSTRKAEIIGMGMDRRIYRWQFK